jgi:hypothetical protein
MVSISRSPDRVSSAAVGSSARRSAGRPTAAAAKATRCCWPPDSRHRRGGHQTGDDRLVQDPEDGLTSTFLFGPLPDIAVAERQQDLTMAMRDHLNEGGKLVQAGENAQYAGLLGRSLGGVYYGSTTPRTRTASSAALATPAERADVLGRILDRLHEFPRR